MKEGGDNEGSNNEGSNNEGGEHGPNAPGLDHLVDASDRDVRLGLGLGFGIIDIDGDAKVHTPKHLTRIVLDKDVDAINRERPVDECCLGERLRFYWTLEDWEQKSCFIELIGDHLKVGAPPNPAMEKVALDFLRAPGWGVDMVDFAKNWAMMFVAGKDYIDLESEDLYAGVEAELAKRGLELAGPRAFEPAPPLIHAIMERRLDDALALLRDGADPNAKRDSDGKCALHWALSYGTIDFIKTLLDFGADPNARDRWGRTPLVTAASLSGERPEPAVLRLLLERGADPNTVCTGTTALGMARLVAWASGEKGKQVERILIEAGATE
jgi:hypothetical protein